MPVREGPPQPPPPPKPYRRQNRMRPVDEPKPYLAEKARGGEIVLRTRVRRFIFIAGLVGVIVLVLMLRLWT
jgi:hypothetical protein